MLIFLTGAAVSYNYSMHELVEKFVAPLPRNKLELEVYQEDMEESLKNLPIVKKLSKRDDLIETRSWESFNTISHLPLLEENNNHEFGEIGKALTDPGGIAIAPLIFNDAKNKKSYVIVHLGKRLSGYPFIVHGGILGLLVDEVFKKSCGAEYGILDVNTLHAEKSVLSYRFPTFINTFVLFETECEQIGDDKYKVKGSIFNAKSHRKLIDAEVVINHGILPQPKQEEPKKKGKGFLWA